MNFINMRREVRALTENAIKSNMPRSELLSKLNKISNTYLGEDVLKNDIIDAIVKEYDYATKNSLVKEERQTLSELFASLNNDFAKTKAGINKKVVDVVRLGLKAGEFSKDIQNRIEGVIGTARNYANTIQRTAVSGFDTLSQYKDDDEKTRYTYVHVPTKRPFCVACLAAVNSGKTWTRKEIESMNNGQGLNPFIYHGGYNCRGQFVRIK
jgi:hypothetical protein